MCRTLLPKTADSIATFDRLTNRDIASGLTALYAYESQQPEVAAEKLRGLRDCYGIHSLKLLVILQFTPPLTWSIGPPNDPQLSALS